MAPSLPNIASSLWMMGPCKADRAEALLISSISTNNDQLLQKLIEDITRKT